MSGNDEGGGELLAQWLKEAGRRAQSNTKTQDAVAADSDDTFNSPASLHRYLEELAGRKLQTHTEVVAFLKEVAGGQPEGYREHERRRMVREVALIILLAVSYLHFYYWEVQLEIAALKGVTVLVPTPARPSKIRS